MNRIVFVVEIEEISDSEMYAEYIKRVAKLIKLHKGEYIARSNIIHPFSGKAPLRCVIIAFESKEGADRCFHSEEYAKIRHLREESTRSKAFFVENERIR